MTEEEHRVAIAKHIGIEPLRRWRVWYDKERQHGSICIPTRAEAEQRRQMALQDCERFGMIAEDVSDPEEYDEWRDAPDYPHDLNAMHEAEKTLTPTQWHQYNAHLARITMHDRLFAMVSATAAQRAQAFLRTVGKWEGAG